MKSLVTALFILGAQHTFAASLHCDLFQDQMIPFADIALASVEELKATTATYKIGSHGGLDVYADVIVRFGTEFVQVYTKANGVYVGSGTRLLLIDTSKKALDVRCEIVNKSPMEPTQPIPSGPQI